MTPRTFWMILIRILGIYIILDSWAVVTPFLSSIYYTGRHETGSDFVELVTGLVLILGIYFLFFWYFVFQTEWVIDKLKLDKGFTEDKLEINIHRSTILTVVVIVIGGLMLVDALPILSKQTFIYFQLSGPDRGFKENPASGWIIYYLVKVFIVLFMITTSRLIVNLIELKRKGTTHIKVD